MVFLGLLAEVVGFQAELRNWTLLQKIASFSTVEIAGASSNAALWLQGACVVIL